MSNVSVDTYILGGVSGFNLMDPSGRWALTDATELPTFGGPDVQSISLPGVDGVMDLAPSRVTPITVQVQVLVQKGYENAFMARARRYMNSRAMFDLAWRPRWASSYRIAPARMSSDMSVSYPGFGQEILVKFTMEVTRGYWEEYLPTWRTCYSTTPSGSAVCDLSESWAPAIAPWIGVQPLGSGTQSCTIRDGVSREIIGFRFLTGGYRYLIDTINRKVYQGPNDYDVTSAAWIAWVANGDSRMSYLNRASQAVSSRYGGFRMTANPQNGQGLYTGVTTAVFCLFYKYCF